MLKKHSQNAEETFSHKFKYRFRIDLHSLKNHFTYVNLLINLFQNAEEHFQNAEETFLHKFKYRS